MRRAVAILLLLFIATLSFGQKTNAAGEVAHGSEKEAQKVPHPSEGHGEGHARPKTYFGIPGWILKFVNMLLFIGFLGYLIVGPIQRALIARRETVNKAAEEARERRAKADQLARDIQARLTQIEEEVRAIHARAQQEGERQKRELMAAAEAEAAKILQAARNEVDNRLRHARHELTEYAAQLSADRAAAILKEKITEDDQRNLFRSSLKEVEEARS